MMMMTMAVCVFVCEQNASGPEKDAEAVVFRLHRHPVGTQSGAAAGVPVVPGEFLAASASQSQSLLINVVSLDMCLLACQRWGLVAEQGDGVKGTSDKEALLHKSAAMKSFLMS